MFGEMFQALILFFRTMPGQGGPGGRDGPYGTMDGTNRGYGGGTMPYGGSRENLPYGSRENMPYGGNNGTTGRDGGYSSTYNRDNQVTRDGAQMYGGEGYRPGEHQQMYGQHMNKPNQVKIECQPVIYR